MIISIKLQVYFEGIYNSQTTANRAKAYFENPLILVDFWGKNKHLKSYETLKFKTWIKTCQL